MENFDYQYGGAGDSGGLDSSDQAFLGLLGQADAGVLPADAATDSWAGSLNDTINGTENQTDAVIWNAEHLPGYDGGSAGGGYSSAAADALHGFNIADGIQASSYQNFEAGLTSDDTSAAIADAGAADATAD
jgi:hypothetical protein